MADVAPTELRTVVDVLGLSSAYLDSRGSSTPRLDAELLLGRVIGLSRLELYLHHDRPLEPDELTRFRELIRRRGTGEPVAYLLGERAFRRVVLRSDERALVPRPETETLVEVVLAALPEGGALLDLGTGSGNIAISVADERPDVSVVAVDASADAIALAQANVDELVPGRVELFVSDLYAAVPPGRMFDVVAGNLPYVADDDPGLESQVAKHEPALALYGGPDGLDIIRRAAAEVPTWLKPGGTMVIECGGAQEDLIGDVMLGAGLIDVRTARDLAGIERVVYARLPADA